MANINDTMKYSRPSENAQIKDILLNVYAALQEKDDSILRIFAPQDVCVYCNHCQPCPMDLDIGQ